jgi:basic membrane protein A
MNITRRDAVKLGAGVFGTASALGLAAAQKVNPQVKGSYNFEAGFTDASFGTKICEQWIAATSLDVMWGDASAVDNGARKAFENAGADTHFDIAQPIDAVGDAQPSVVTSTVMDWMFGEAMDQVEAGEFGDGKVIEANIDNGGAYLGSFSSKVPEDVQKKIVEYTEQVKAGTLISDADVDAIKATL